MRSRQRRNIIRTLKGFALSLLLHLLVLLLFWVSSEKIFSPPPPKDRQKKITLDLSQFVPPAPPPKPQVKPVPPPQPVIPPRPKPEKVVEKKPEPKKKVLKEKKILTAKKDLQENNVTKSAKKPEKKILKKKEEKKVVKKEKKVPKKKVVKKAPPKKPKKRVVQKRPRKKQYASPLANSLMGSTQSKSMQTSPRRAARHDTRRMIKQLYGSEFNSYGAEQKKFIENNLAIIHRITQMTLNRNGYPETAARTGQQGVNVVSFYLHPNGNISGLRLEKSMGHGVLDKNTLQVIRIAYKDYPLPRKKTKLKFFVQYSIGEY